MSRGIAPWWERGWSDWWANQRTALLLEDPKGRFWYDSSRHRAHWRGLIAATGGRWAIEIHWGPGTPFFPPYIYPDGYYSRYHQLRDGALCLAPPGFTEVVDISDWLSQTRQWLDGYVREGWSVSEGTWQLVSIFRPDPGYRLHERPRSYLLLPFDWNPPAASGEIWATLPQSGGGLGVLRRWRPAGQSEWVDWSKGTSFMPRGGEDIRGFWARTLEAGRSASTESFWARLVGRRQRCLISYPVHYQDGSSGWEFSLHDPNKIVETAKQLRESHGDRSLGSLLLMITSQMVTNSVIRGLPMRADELALRTRVSRKNVDDARVRGACVVVVGLGALGSEVAHLLAKEQIGRFVLVDGDLLLPGNIARHRLGLPAVGGNKAEQMKAHIEQNHLDAEVTVVPAMLDETLPSLELPAHAILIGLTGHIPSERVLSAVASERHLPCLHAWLEYDGQVLRLLRTVPGLDPCLHEISELPALPKPNSHPPPEECADVILAGSASNIHAAANVVARAVLDLLGSRMPPENHVLFAPGGLDSPEDGIPAALAQRYGMIACQIRKAA